MRPWEETWTWSDYYVVDDRRMAIGSWHYAQDEDAGLHRARLAAAAPDLVRALLKVEWAAGKRSDPVCPYCEAHKRPQYGSGTLPHWDHCQLDAALRKAGVR